MNSQHTPFKTIEGVCGIPARKSGFVSLIIQTVSLTISFFIVITLFFHIGGYLKVIPHHSNFTINSIFLIESNEDNEIGKILNTTTDEKEITLQLKPSEKNGTFFFKSSSTEQNDFKDKSFNKIYSSEHKLNYHGPFEQIDDVKIKIGHLEINLLSILRGTCMLFLALCAFWLISVLGLIASLKFEILDFVFINTFMLTTIALFALVKAFLTGILIFYENKTHWKSLIAVSVSVGVLLLCFVFNIAALSLTIIWIRYIEYINENGGSCFCTSKIVKCVKGHTEKRRGNGINMCTTPADYSIPEATRHSNLPYIDDSPIQQFSNF